MNREITTKKVGRQKKLTNPCPVIKGEVKRWWLRDLQIWYVFFYEKKGGKVRGVLGKDRTKDLIRSIL